MSKKISTAKYLALGRDFAELAEEHGLTTSTPYADYYEPYQGLWLSPVSKEPLKFELWQSSQIGSDPVHYSAKKQVVLDISQDLRHMFTEEEPVLKRRDMERWAKALHKLATEIESAVARGFYTVEGSATESPGARDE